MVDPEIGTSCQSRVCEYGDVLPAKPGHVLGRNLVHISLVGEEVCPINLGDTIVVQSRYLVPNCPAEGEAHENLLEGAEHNGLGTAIYEQLGFTQSLEVVATVPITGSIGGMKSEARETVPRHERLGTEEVLVVFSPSSCTDVERILVFVLRSFTEEVDTHRVHQCEPRQGIRESRHTTATRTVQNAGIESYVSTHASCAQSIPGIGGTVLNDGYVSDDYASCSIRGTGVVLSVHVQRSDLCCHSFCICNYRRSWSNRRQNHTVRGGG